MKNKFANWQIAGFIFVSVVGTLLHFVYDWSSQSVLVAPFSAVNESIWEHIKLIYFPMLLFSLIEYKFVGKNYDTFWCVKAIGSILAVVLIPTFYYTYTGISGKSVDWINILIFFITTAIIYYIENKLIHKLTRCNKTLAIAIIVLIGIAFVLFTWFTPQIPLFQDPVNKTYGI